MTLPGIFITREFMFNNVPYYTSNVNFAQAKEDGFGFAVLEAANGLEKHNLYLNAIVDSAKRDGMPLLVLIEADAPAYFEYFHAGGFDFDSEPPLDNPFWYQLRNIIKDDKEINGIIFRFTNTTMHDGKDLPKDKFAQMFEGMLKMYRNWCQTVNPRITPDRIFFMMEEELIDRKNLVDLKNYIYGHEKFCCADGDKMNYLHTGLLSDIDPAFGGQTPLWSYALEGWMLWYSGQAGLTETGGVKGVMVDDFKFSTGGMAVVGVCAFNGDKAKFDDVFGIDDVIVPPDEESTRYLGIDVSRHKGTLNWNEIASYKIETDPVRFAVPRAGISYGYVDPQFIVNWQEAQRVGIPRSAYHVLYPGESVVDQVAAFHAIILSAGAGESELPVVADIELHHGYDKTHMANVIEDYLSELEYVFQRNPIIYTGAWFFDAFVDQSFIDNHGNEYYWWVANYPDEAGVEATFEPRIPAGLNRNRVIIHQTSDSMPSLGGAGVMDYNRWLGSAELFAELIEDDGTEPPDPPIIQLLHSLADTCLRQYDLLLAITVELEADND